MLDKTIKNNRFEVYILDTSRNIDVAFHKELTKKIEESLSVFTSFFLNKSGLHLKEKNVEEFSLSLTLCGNSKIRTMNREYRGKDKITDVLSFPVNESLRPEYIDEFIFPHIELGDIFISLPVSKKQSVEFDISHADEVLQELTHAILHLCGYDHEVNKIEEDLMFELEEKLVKQISKKLRANNE